MLISLPKLNDESNFFARAFMAKIFRKIQISTYGTIYRRISRDITAAMLVFLSPLGNQIFSSGQKFPIVWQHQSGCRGNAINTLALYFISHRTIWGCSNLLSVYVSFLTLEIALHD